MTFRINSNRLKNIIIFALLFFAAMNFFAKFFYFVFAAFFFLLVIQKKIKINNISFLYLAVGVLMAIYNYREGILSMLRCLACFMFYIVGYNMSVITKEESGILSEDRVLYSSQNVSFAMIIAMCLGAFVHYLLNAVTNAGTFIGRNTIDIWSGEIMAATGQATLVCLMCGLAVASIYMPLKKVYRYIAIVSIVAILMYNLILAGRTVIVILLFLFMIGFVYTFIKAKDYVKRTKLILGLLIVFATCSLIFIFNFWGIRDHILTSNLGNRVGTSFDSFIFDSPRIECKINFITNAWRYPFGGMNMRNQFGYAHDLLLDGYDEYGIFGFLLLVVILVATVVGVFKLLKCRGYEDKFKLLVLCIFVAILLNFCVEPILAGMPWLFACFSLFSGAIDGMNCSYKIAKME